VLVIYNGNRHVVTVDVPAAAWRIVVNDKAVNESGMGQHRGGKLTVPASSAMVLVQ
jgi:pullulanase